MIFQLLYVIKRRHFFLLSILLQAIIFTPLTSKAQDKTKIDSFIRKFSGGGRELLIVFDSLWAEVEKGDSAERTTSYRRIVAFIDSTRRADSHAITAYAVYLKAFLQKNKLALPYEAFRTIMEATDMAEKSHENDLLFLCLAQAAHINYEIENFGETVRFGLQAIEVFENLSLADSAHYDIEIMSIQRTVGDCNVILGQYSEALKHFEVASNLARTFRNEEWRTLIASSEATVYVKMGKSAEALPMFIESYRLGKSHGNWRLASGQAIRISELFLLNDNVIMARRYIDSARLCLAHSPDHVEGAWVDYWKNLAALEKAEGNFPAAFGDQEKFVDAYMKLKASQHAVMLTNMEASYDFERNQRTIVALRHDNDKQQTFVIVVVIILGLLGILVAAFIYSYRRQRKTSRYIALQHDEIALKNAELEKQSIVLHESNAFIQKQRDEIEIRNSSLNNAMAELKSTQEQLVHSEKMSSLGQLTAGLMHEINNPINFIQSGAEALQENIKALFEVIKEYEATGESNVKEQMAKINRMKHDLDFEILLPEILTLLKTIRNGAERTASIVSNLHRFSRKGGEDLTEMPVSKPIEATLLLVASELKAKVTVTTHFEEDLVIEGRLTELQQVFMNILMNAFQAINYVGHITITATRNRNRAVISIRDNGPGIPEDIRGKIFDPFFTTKPVGKGMGMGLSITFRIIHDHSGSIEVRNSPEGGAEFIISLPARMPTN